MITESVITESIITESVINESVITESVITESVITESVITVHVRRVRDVIRVLENFTEREVQYRTPSYYNFIR